LKAPAGPAQQALSKITGIDRVILKELTIPALFSYSSASGTPMYAKPCFTPRWKTAGLFFSCLRKPSPWKKSSASSPRGAAHEASTTTHFRPGEKRTLHDVPFSRRVHRLRGVSGDIGLVVFSATFPIQSEQSGTFLRPLPLLFIFLIPALTMRTFSEDLKPAPLNT